MALLGTASLLRRDPRVLTKAAPYLSLLCIAVGVAWLLLLPLDEYCRRTYISENALLPAQVHTYFGGSDHNILRALQHEIQDLAETNTQEVNDKLGELLEAAGLKVARQKYEYHSSGVSYGGENIYGILQAPRGDATEAIVLVGAWKAMDGRLNSNGVALLITLARYFKRWSLWSKDIIFLVTPDSKAGPQAWVDAYHDAHSPATVASLPLTSGALQGAIAIDYPLDHKFESIHFVYDGINGQLPNLDLLNSATAVARDQMGIGVSLQQMWQHDGGYKDRLQTMLRGMLNQGLGHGSGAHSSFIPYHVDAVTLQPFGDGWQDEMAMGRVIEGTFRSLNNLLEHLHQSFFFYLLIQVNRFVSIGTYLPSAMLVAVNFTIMAIALWLESGQSPGMASSADITSIKSAKSESSQDPVDVLEHRGAVAISLATDQESQERKLFLPLAIVIGSHLLGVVPLFIFNNSNVEMLTVTFIAFSVANALLPIISSFLLFELFTPTQQQCQLMKCFSLLLLGMCLSALATLNFSIAFLVGLLATPLTYLPSFPKQRQLAKLIGLLMNLVAPPAILFACSQYWQVSINDILKEAAFGWDVWHLTTQVVIWCVWWPAWMTGTMLLFQPSKKNTDER